MPAPPRVAVTLTQCWHRVPGGSATSVLRLIDAIGAVGGVELVGVGACGDLRRPSSMLPGRLPGAPWTPPVPCRSVPLPLPLLYDAWTRWGRPSIGSATGPVDLVHVTVPVRVPVGAVPVVATVHDLFPLTAPELMTGRGARLTRAGLDWIRRHAALVMVPSGTVEAQCIDRGFTAERLRVVPWGAEVSVPDDGDVDAVLRRHGITRPYVLFAGTLEPRKNVPALLRAMSLLARPDVTLVLAGPTGWGASLTEDLAAVPSPVVHAGFLDAADLSALQRGAAAFCFPSLAEGFGLPVLEAMAAGAAVVTSSGTATEEVAGDAALLVDPHDVPGLADAIAVLLDDPARAAVLRSRAVGRAEGFRWDRAARSTVQAYLEVLR
jgi:glycosyltransferase involved in cell wall biosynthesis